VHAGAEARRTGQPDRHHPRAEAQWTARTERERASTDRLVAPPGSKVYGIPSAKLAWYATSKRVGTVPRAVFWPVPNVESGLVRFVRVARPAAPADRPVSRAAVFDVIDAAFSQRRKMLRSALAGWAGSAARAEQVLLAAGVDPTARGETLDIDAFARIAAARSR